MDIIGHDTLANLEGTISIRSAVIPVVKTAKGSLSFLFGRKSKGNCLTDFGGGCKVKKRESPIDCALRELTEELSIPEIICKVKERIHNPAFTTIIRASASNKESVEKRYWFLVLINIDPSITRGFLATKEIASINWYDSSVFSRGSSVYPISDSFVGCFNYMKQIQEKNKRFLKSTIQVK